MVFYLKKNFFCLFGGVLPQCSKVTPDGAQGMIYSTEVQTVGNVQDKHFILETMSLPLISNLHVYNTKILIENLPSESNLYNEKIVYQNQIGFVSGMQLS